MENRNTNGLLYTTLVVAIVASVSVVLTKVSPKASLLEDAPAMCSQTNYIQAVIDPDIDAFADESNVLGATGVPIGDDLSNQFNTQIVEAIGGPIVVWEDDSLGGRSIIARQYGPDDPSNPTTLVPVWTYTVFPGNIMPGGVVAQNVRVAPDLDIFEAPNDPLYTGGVVIMWNDDRSGNQNIYGVRIYNGTVVHPWLPYGSPLVSDDGGAELDQVLNDLVAVPGDENSGIRSAFPFTFTTVNETDGTYDVRAQATDLGGALLVGGGSNDPNEALLLSDAAGNQMNSRATGTDGGLAVAFESDQNGSLDVYAQKAAVDDTTGAISVAWGSAGVPVAVGNGDQHSPKLVGDGLQRVLEDDPVEGAYITWANDLNGGLYFQHLDSDGAVVKDCPTAGVQVSGATPHEAQILNPGTDADPAQLGVALGYINTNGNAEASLYTYACAFGFSVPVSHNVGETAYSPRLIEGFGNDEVTVSDARNDQPSGGFFSWLSNDGTNERLLAQFISGREVSQTTYGTNGLVDLDLTDLITIQKYQTDYNRSIVGFPGVTIPVWDTLCDTDGDGITDPEDECPLEPGPASNNGCPEQGDDTDGDGVPNTDDQCPEVAGSADFLGCPAGIRVAVHYVDASGDVPAVNISDAAYEVRVFDAGVGSCANQAKINPRTYNQIFTQCAPENRQLETNSPDSLLSELVTIGVLTGDKLVLVQSSGNADGSHAYIGFKLPAVQSGDARDLGFEQTGGMEDNFVPTASFTADAKGVWHGTAAVTVP